MLIAAPFILISSAAPAQERDSPGFLDNLFSRGESTGQQIAQANESEVAIRLDRLENQLRQITGALEQLQFRNQQLEQQLSRLQSGAPAAPGNTVMPPPQQPAPRTVIPGNSPTALPPPTSGRRSDVFDPHQSPNAPGAPRALGGGPVASAPPVIDEPVGAPGGRAAGAPLDLSTLAENAPGAPPQTDGALPAPPARNTSATGQRLATLPPSASPKDEYDLAYGYVLRKDYALAEQTFRDFVRKYPNDRMAAEANYWLGETMFQRQRYQDAADSFLVVVRNHERTGKAPDALLRLGQSLAALGQKEMACASLAEVERKYPRASAGVKKNVEQEQKRARC